MFIQDVARPSMPPSKLLKLLSENITLTQKGKVKTVDLTDGMDYSKEYAEIALQYIDIIVNNK